MFITICSFSGAGKAGEVVEPVPAHRVRPGDEVWCRADQRWVRLCLRTDGTVASCSWGTSKAQSPQSGFKPQALQNICIRAMGETKGEEKKRIEEQFSDVTWRICQHIFSCRFWQRVGCNEHKRLCSSYVVYISKQTWFIETLQHKHVQNTTTTNL